MALLKSIFLFYIFVPFEKYHSNRDVPLLKKLDELLGSKDLLKRVTLSVAPSVCLQGFLRLMKFAIFIGHHFEMTVV